VQNDVTMLILSAIAGIVGTGIGGAIGALAKKKSQKSISDMLAFAGGVMLSIVLVDMLPEAVKTARTACKMPFGALSIFVFLVSGGLIANIVGLLAKKAEEKRQNTALEHRKSRRKPRKVNRGSKKPREGDATLKQAGAVTLFAIAFHNIPEGLAIGASGVQNVMVGVAVALAIALHNVPEGMAISAPLVKGGTKPVLAVGLSLLAGLPTLVGAVIGVLVGGASPFASVVSLSLSSGAMLFVSIFDLLPLAVKLRGEFSPLGFGLGIILTLALSLFV